MIQAEKMKKISKNYRTVLKWLKKYLRVES